MMQQILILGGSNFIGRHLVEAFEQQPQYAITLFSRGQTNAHLFPDLPKIVGDRNTDDVQQLAQSWDYVIDLSGYFPDSVVNITKAVKDVKRYVYVSSCSAYDNANELQPLKSESTPLLPCSTEERTDQTPQSYGQRKAESERALIASGLEYIILRPALVVGPYDPTDRLYYWLHQVKHRRDLLLPDNGVPLFSVTYVNDLVQTILKSLTNQPANRAYNVTSIPQCSIGQIVRETMHQTSAEPRLHSAPAAFLHQHEVTQWSGMPLWIDGNHFTYSNEHWLNDFGLQPTPFAEAISTCIDYAAQQKWPEPTFGISEAERRTLLDLLLR